jgi:hypothetical protein
VVSGPRRLNEYGIRLIYLYCWLFINVDVVSCQQYIYDNFECGSFGDGFAYFIRIIFSPFPGVSDPIAKSQFITI